MTRSFTNLLSAFMVISLMSFAIPSGITQQNDYQGIMEDEFPSDGPGATAIVAKGDKIHFLGAAGLANIELNVPMKPGHILRLGSITKQFTAVSILKLVEEGKMKLQDEITKYLPEYPTNGKKITIEHLLTHTSGIQSYTNMPGFMQERTKEDMTVLELIDVFKEEPMEFDPGERWNYNNSGYILLGAIIEEVSGKTYEDYVVENLFLPLNLKNMYYGGREKIIPNRASGYSQNDDQIVHARFLSMTLPYAAGSLIGNVFDLYKWNQALWKGQVISTENLKKAHTPYVLNSGEATNYGYGWVLEEYMGNKAITHGGGIFGFLTQGMYLPEEELFVAVFSNCDCKSPNSAANRLAALALGKSLEFEQIDLEPSEMEAYTGVYQVVDSEDKRKVYVEEGQLYTQRNEGQVFEIIAYQKDQFYYPDSRTTLSFSRDPDGNINGHTITPINGNVGHATKTSEKVSKTEFVALSEATLQNYIGSYELAPNFILDIRLEEGKLIGQATGQGPIEIQAIAENEFVNQQIGAKIIFEKLDGSSTYLVLHQGGTEMKAPRVKSDD